jgi:hypothetical protein
VLVILKQSDNYSGAQGGGNFVPLGGVCRSVVDYVRLHLLTNIFIKALN